MLAAVGDKSVPEVVHLFLGLDEARQGRAFPSDSVRSKLTVSDGHLIVHHPANPDEGRDRAFAHPNAWASRLIACAAAQQRIMPPSKYCKKTNVSG